MAKTKARVTNGGGREKEATVGSERDVHVRVIEKFIHDLFTAGHIHAVDQRTIQQALVRRIKQRIG